MHVLDEPWFAALRGRLEGADVAFERLLDEARRTMRALIESLFEASGVRFDGLRVAIDCANGAASEIAPEVFRRLGAAATVLSASPDGRNINEQCGSLHMNDLQEAVLSERLDLGIAFDGDADRAAPPTRPARVTFPLSARDSGDCGVRPQSDRLCDVRVRGETRG